MNFETYYEKVYFNLGTVMGIDIFIWQKFILLVNEIDRFSIVINTFP